MLGLGISRARARVDAEASTLRPAAAPQPVTLGEGADERLAPAAAELARHAGGGRVLVVAAGEGFPALAALPRCGHVVATEQDAQLRDAGAARVPQAEWHAAPPRRLPFDDASFDAVLAYFGAAYERDQRRLAAELTRVAAPGATVALAAWAGDDARRVNALQPPGGPRPGNWSRYETAYLHFFDFADLDVVEHDLDGVGRFCVVSGRRP